MTTWMMRRYPNLLAPLEVDDGNGHREEFTHIQDAWDYVLGHMDWNDSVITEDMTAPAPPDPAQHARVAVRNTNPAPSQQAARTRAPGWDKGLGRALRIMFEHRAEEEGLCCWDVEYEGEQRWGKNGVRHERFYNLSNPAIFNPPLVSPALRADGTQYTHPGENGDPQDCYRINQHGIALYWESYNAQ